MNKRIHKFNLGLGVNTVRASGRIITNLLFGAQEGRLRLWAEVDVDAHEHMHHYYVVGTGGAAPDTGIHVGSLQDGPYVWHLYQV